MMCGVSYIKGEKKPYKKMYNGKISNTCVSKKKYYYIIINRWPKQHVTQTTVTFKHCVFA